MKIAITGANGFVGQYITQAAMDAGHQVTSFGRSRPLLPGVTHNSWLLGEIPDLSGHDALIHAAFHHAPGRYRGGEGNDPEGFVQTNLSGSIALFEFAKAAGLEACLFLSSRAVFDGYPPGTCLTEDLTPLPTTLYGRVKAEAESALADLSSATFRTANLRPTGVYGMPLDGSQHKWAKLFAEFRAGQEIEPHVATEVHAGDLASAVLLALNDLTAGAKDARGPTNRNFNVSDLVLDRRELLKLYAAKNSLSGENLPPAKDRQGLKILRCQRTEEIGWRPGGLARLSTMLENVAVKSPGAQ
ncbi:NAD(P)-dependent oxidoreductase [Paracoccus suum]|uniref:NAD(P)-dependent oxidoreductase n=1 Tax=Paracoccus suum TaxID=2259340 RepID=A0A344PHM7_9RHOB|nr:NAD(P)-dependent oxidoreductase [Paracoccus suum]AXC48882.1 NAD(P)-dependent oxidoreductase [Paracoccus suum]